MRLFEATVVAFLFCCGIAGGAAADQVIPPSPYDHAHPNLIIDQRNYYDVDPLCRSRFPRSNFPPVSGSLRIMGCADIGDGRSPCRIVVPLVGGLISEERQAMIIRHERAHCNGWPASHPG
jgi:hypothetical protein